MKELMSILLRSGVALLALSLNFLAVRLLQSGGVILPVPGFTSLKSTLIMGIAGVILVISGMLLYKRADC
jgi:hypothetical protein